MRWQPAGRRIASQVVPIELSTCAAELAARDALPAHACAVFVAGSLVRGWGNAASDLDVYVIGGERPDGPGLSRAPVVLRPDTVPIRTMQVGERTWEIEYWTRDQVEQIFDKISWAEFDRNQTAGDLLSGYERAFLERLSHAVGVTGEDWLTENRDRLRRSALGPILVSRALGEVDRLIEDAVGQLESGDLHSAVLSARLALGFAVDALLATCGEYNQSPKWRARCLRAVEQDVLPFDRYWHVETMRDYRPDDPGPWITEVIDLCWGISMEASR
jgi:predicted nucleotidyltransferase